MKSETKRLAFFLPNIFTALNLWCGFFAMLLAWNGSFYKACMFIVLGSIFDLVDGRVARLTGTQSSFGEQFDSISDVVSFALAPAIISYCRFFSGYGRVGIVVAFIFILCGALRLARFNANIDKVNPAFFQGLPVPCAAWAIIGYVLFSLEFDILNKFPVIAMVLVVFYGILMISNVPFYSFKKSAWVMKYKKGVLALIFLLFALIVIYEELMIGCIISLYVFGSLGYFLTHRKQFKDIFNWQSDAEEGDED